MNLYLITFQSSLNRIESVYDCHKDLFVEIEKFFTLHLVPYTEAASIPLLRIHVAISREAASEFCCPSVSRWIG